MIIIEGGKITIVPDLPSDYSSPEWQAYDQACDKAQAAGQGWTQEQTTTYNAYRGAMQTLQDANPGLVWCIDCEAMLPPTHKCT